MGLGKTLRAVIIATCTLYVTATSSDPEVTHISPRIGGRGGAVRITIYGQNFANDQFTFGTGNEQNGNAVVLVGPDLSHTCNVHIDGSTEVQIMCDTPSGMSHNVQYFINVKVNGESIPESKLCSSNKDWCYFKPHNWYNPTISGLSQQSYSVGSEEIILTIYGKIITQRYGSNTDTSPNGRTEKIKRAYVGGSICELHDEDTNAYGIALDSDDSYYGSIKCRITGTFIGYGVVTFLIDDPYGRSVTDSSIYHVSRNNHVYTITSYSEIKSVYPHIGSVKGGTTLRIDGYHFELGGEGSTYSKLAVNVAGVPCEILDVVKDGNVTCVTALKPADASEYPGGRGLYVDYWTSGPYDTNADLRDTTTTPTGSKYLDQMYFCEDADLSTNYIRMTTFFKAPNTGYYAFYLKATNGGELYLNGESMAVSSGSWSTKGRRELTKDSYNKLIVVAMSGSNSAACVQVMFRFYQTELLSSRTERVRQEVQEIQFRLPVLHDEMAATFSGFTAQNNVSDIQTICPSGGTEARLGVYGVYTLAKITFSETTSIMEAELNKLPVLSSEGRFTVALNTSDSSCYDVTYYSKRGDIPSITTNTAGVTIQSTEVRAGVPDNKMFSFMYGGIPGPLEEFDDTDKTAFATKLQTMLEGVFSVRCPSIFTTGASLYEDFEMGSSKFGSSAVTDTVPFCGRYSYKNPSEVFPIPESNRDTLQLALYPWMCLAVKGLGNTNLYLNYVPPGQSERKNRPFTFQGVTVPVSEGGWTYTCINLLETVKNQHTGITGENYQLKRVYFTRTDSETDFYVDELWFGKSSVLGSMTDLTGVRLGPGSPHPSTQVLVESVAVAYDETLSQYNITIVPHDCGSGLDLLTLANADLTGSKTHPSTQVTSTLKGGSASMSVESITKATPAIQGTFTVTINGETTDSIDVQDTDENIQRVIESSTNIGTVIVTSSEDSTCYMRDLQLEFASLKGDQDLGEVDFTTVNGATATMVAKTDGHLEENPIFGDYLRTVHDKPQVEVIVNGVPSKCKEGVDCSFEYKDEATPEITSLSPLSGSNSGSLTISGTLLSSSATVMIGGVACTVVTADASSIQCTIGDGPIGEHGVIVHVPGMGCASGNLNFTYTSDLSDINPKEGALGGGIELTLTGFGFSTDSKAYVNDQECPLTATPTPARMLCLLPAYTTLTATTDQAATVKVTRDGNDMSTTHTFTYKPDLTATISTLNYPDPLHVSGNEVISITGQDFGSSPTVSIGGNDLEIVSSSDTAIEAKTPVLMPGDDQMLEVNNGNGLALYNDAIPEVDVALRVDNMYPAKGSLYGGTQITLTGWGFGTEEDDVKVYVGDTRCEVDDLTDVQIVCTIADTGTKHYVSNEGTSDADVYFGYNVTSLKAVVGDSVLWSWTSPDYLTDVQHGIYETASLTSTDILPDGISSGVATRQGNFIYQFVSPGQYYIYSGIADEYGSKSYRMTVEVSDKTSSSGPLTVMVSGQEATHNVGGAGDPSNSGCAILTSDRDDCTPESITHADSSKFNFEYSNCRTPVVSSFTFTNASMDPRTATGSSVLTVTGQGFSDSNGCTNEAHIGDCDCEVTPVSSTQFTCIIDSACSYPIAQYLPLSLDVKGYGSAQVNVRSLKARSVAFLPEITGISPTSGSSEGGTEITVTGSRLSDATLAQVGDTTAAFVNNAGTLIVTTPASLLTSGLVKVFINQFQSQCSISGGTCDFQYTSAKTPKVTEVSPNMVSGVTDLTFTGEKFGSDASSISITIGGEECVVQSLDSEISLTCEVAAVPHGSHKPVLTVAGFGIAETTVSVTGQTNLTGVSPSSGSIYGGTNITLTGHGFHGATTVSVDGTVICEHVSTTLTSVMCVTMPRAAGAVDLAVVSNGVDYGSQSFTYAVDDTPDISSVSPSYVVSGDTLVIDGSGFGTNKDLVHVYVGDYMYEVDTAADNQLQITLGDQTSGDYTVVALVDGKGWSDSETVTYRIQTTGVSPSSGPEAGNQLLTISGAGFTSNVVAKVCDKVCEAETVSATQFVCVTPAGSVSDGNCNVTVEDQLTGYTVDVGVYAYTATPVPELTGIDPTNGGTGGGTKVTITGTSLSGSAVSVSIAGIECVYDVGESSATEIVCTTGAHSGTIVAPVLAIIDGARATGTLNFNYVDRWSSPATWGGGPLPAEGELISIPSGQHVLLDQDTPILEMLVIEGILTFDSAVAELTLNSKRILIVNGGKLEVGTLENPYPSKADIVLHGHHRDGGLPIYGTKNIAVRKGELNLHGKFIPNTWARLENTANAGSSEVTLKWPADGWNVGDEIIVATTGDKNSQKESEKRTISAISGDKKTLTLTEPLEYTHTAMDYSCLNGEGGEIWRDLSGEVGLLSRNVRVRGNNDPQWNLEIEACQDGFDPGEFATQTCFQGRFGEETGSNQFGAHIIVHSPSKDTQDAQAHLSFVEVTFAGQAFQLGRYPIHFHLNGNMSKSYVTGCSIHHTFNRAINVHGSHNVKISKNVGYNIMGGAFFLEDGIETGNEFDENLLIFVKASTSLLNDDVTAASIWITHPNNIYSGNAVAGGTHFGYWYRMLEHPEGPSHDTSIYPRKEPLGIFNNNTVHSCGWFGLWIFEDFYPMNLETGEPVPALFTDLTTWNNEKGAECVNCAYIVFVRLVSLNNDLAGLEWKKALNHECSGSNVKESCISGNINSGDPVETNVAVKVPYGHCFQMEDVYIEHCLLAFELTEITGTCTTWCGGFVSSYKGLRFNEVTNIVNWRWIHEGAMLDEDGSFCDSSPAIVMPDSGSHIPDNLILPACGRPSKGLTTKRISDSVKLIRIAVTGMVPSSAEGKNLTFQNQYGTTFGYYHAKKLTHKPGWMAVLKADEWYKMTVQNGVQMTNLSFSGALYGLGEGTCLILGLKVMEEPDNITIDGRNWKNKNESDFTCSTSGLKSGNWFFSSQDDGNWVMIAFVGKTGTSRPQTGSGIELGANDTSFSVQVVKCFYDGCIPPHNPEEDEPKADRDDPYYLWTNTSLWKFDSETSTYFVNESGTEVNQLPPTDADVTIMKGWVVIKDYSPPRLGNVHIYSELEIDYTTDFDYVFEAKNIIIFGGRFVVGWPDRPLLGTANIILAGDQSSPWYTGVSSYTISNKALGVFGGFDSHGRSKGSSWARLASTATAGSTTLTLVSSADVSGWAVGDSIIVTTTAPNPAQTEERTISAVDDTNRIITLSQALTYTHLALTENVAGTDHVFAAAVGLLTRNIVVRGHDVSQWGGRILTSVGEKTINGENLLRSGFVRVSHTEFRNMGQEGFTERYDPRFALSVVGVSASEIKPSNISWCSFHKLHNSALGVFGSGNMPIENNVVYGPVGNGIVTDSKGTILSGNLAANSKWTGGAYGRAESQNIRYEASFWTIGATELTLKNNYAAGSERIGYRTSGENCESNTSFYSENEAVGNLMGVGVFKDDDLTVEAGQTCTRWSSFKTWHNLDFGIYYNNELELRVSDVVVAGEQTGLFPFVYHPSAVDHICSDKEVHIDDSVFIGTLTGNDCSFYTAPTGAYIAFSSHCRGLHSGLMGRLGIIISIFSQAPNNSPLKPCANIMAYNAVCGRTEAKGITFVNFGPNSACKNTFAIAASPKNDDANHGFYISETTLINVDLDYAVLIPKPDVGKINPSDCNDMDCDALKKAMVEDLDGSLMGTQGTWISVSEYEWDGDPRRGYGDYRIPTAMLTAVDGTMIDPDALAPGGRGIIRSGCQHIPVDNTQSYRCPNSKYELMVIESMDDDTETRRLSPVAVLSGGYVDLLNGPQDHGWCNGYACLDRLSTFITLVKPGTGVTIYLTASNPKKMRFFMIHGLPESCIVISYYYTDPNRIDVYTNDGNTYQIPKNGEMVNGKFSYKQDTTVNYVPTCSDPHGANYIDQTSRLVYFVLKGSDKVLLKRTKVFVVSLSLPAMTVEEFFGSRILENIAGLLGISRNMIRVVNVVSASSSRKRRSTGVEVNVQVGSEPTSSADESSDSVVDTTLTGNFVDECQSETIGESLESAGASCTTVTYDETTYTIAVPNELRFEETVVAQHEGVPLATQPKIRAYDTNGDVVPSLGIDGHAWEVTATIRAGTGHASATLSGQTTITSSGGWLNFTDLTISHAGSGYILDFEVTAPSAAAARNFSLSSAAFDIDTVPLTAGLNSITAGDIITNTVFSITLDIRDNTTNERVTDIGWRGHSWAINCGLVLVMPEAGNLTGTLAKTFDNTTGTALFNDLMYSGNGLISIACQIESVPAEYNFTFYQRIIVYTESEANLQVESISVFQIKFNVDYATTLPTDAAVNQFLMAVFNVVQNSLTDSRIVSASVQQGSILVLFTVEGTTTGVTLTRTGLCTALTNGLEVTVGTVTLTLDKYLLIDGADYYATCSGNSDDDDDLHPAIIALIVVVCLLVLIIVGLVLLWKFKIRPKTQTHERRCTLDYTISGERNGEPGSRYAGGFYYIDNGRTVYLGGANQQVQDIFYKQKNGTDMRPHSGRMAAPITTLYDDLDMTASNTRKSPLPGGGFYKDWTMTTPEN